ncbi:MAG TPA: class I tRNA ligase family protein, partial [Longilinea sp.]|nr:class I tRNA ligase family protein [Longilinea sp.]
YDPDPLRYYLTVNMPETKDTDWAWDDFFHRNNDELVATWGNLANRVLSFTYKNWEGKVPDPGELTAQDKELLAKVEAGFETVGKEYEAVHLRTALGEAMALATEVNKYLDVTAPWMAIKTDRQAAGRACFTAIKAIDSLKILLSPVLPFTSERLHTFFSNTRPLFGTQSTETLTDAVASHQILRYHPASDGGKWEPSRLKAGDPLQQPAPLFKKLDAAIVEEEKARLGSK